jgi:hypothetical protein
MKYKVKRLCSKGKNSFYTISPGVYEAKSEPQEVWDYLLKLGSNNIEVINDPEPSNSPSPCDLGNCPIPTPEVEVNTKPYKPRRKSNLNIEEENETNKENI